MLANIVKLAISIAVCQGAGLIGTFFTVSSIDSWYNLLNQPSFRPPNWLFGPVWITLYTLMGISLFLVWHKKNIYALKIFAIQLFFNATWSIVFFGWHQIGLALVNIIVLWIAIVWTIVIFQKINRVAALLLWPYLAWVSFATVLNYNIWILNK